MRFLFSLIPTLGGIGVALACTCALLFASGEVRAQSKRGGLLAPSGPKAGSVVPGKQKRWHAVCATRNNRRRAMALVVAFDRHRDYRPAEGGEPDRLRQLLAVVCPGDVVSLVTIDEEITKLGERMVIKDLADLDALLLRVEERKPPRSYRRLNRQVVEAAVAEWAREEHQANGDLLRVLIYFTRDLESRSPRNAYITDFNWARPPYWLSGHALVALFKPITSNAKVVAWETFIVATPSWVAPDDMDQGLRVDLGSWLDPVRIKPLPPKRDTVKPVEVQKLKIDKQTTIVIPPGTLPDPKAIWQRSDEGALLWSPAWTPWLVSGVLGLLLLLSLGWSLLRGGRHRAGAQGASGHAASQLTLIVRDRIHDTIVSQERVRLEGPLRVGASMTSDVVVPGPYALEILPGTGGGSPRVRSSNSLGLEVQRAGASRTLRATESVPVQLRSGDRINLGGGHLLEVRIA